MERLRDDIRHIKEHMTDHDLLIRLSTMLEAMGPKMDSIERLATFKADETDLRKLEIRVELHEKELKELRAYMNKLVGVGLAFNAFVVIIFGLLSFIKR